jgi:SAM-dependent methyltransferase
LELGCGTGGHAGQFAAAGLHVSGIDLSAPMIARALERRTEMPGEQRQRVEFHQGDARTIRLNETFDAVISLFHVASYQTTNPDQESMFRTARAHLEPGGVFLFDFWYGPAVLRDPPRHVVKEVSDERVRVRRETTPTLLENDNCVDVRFDINVVALTDSRSENFSEHHVMRYLFLPEIDERLTRVGFRLCRAEAWLTGRPLNVHAWYGCVVALAQ